VESDDDVASEDILDVIDDIARLRRQIDGEVKDLRARVSANRPKKKSQFRWFFELKFDPKRVGFASANLQQQAAVFQDIADWWRTKQVRTKAYLAEMEVANSSGPGAKLALLLRIRSECESELSEEIPRLRDLASSLEALRASYKEIVKR
jgi:hypothetical protein